MCGSSYISPSRSAFQRKARRQAASRAARIAFLLLMMTRMPGSVFAGQSDSGRVRIIAPMDAYVESRGTDLSRLGRVPTDLRLIEDGHLFLSFDEVTKERHGWSEPLVYTFVWQLAGMAVLLSLDPEETGFRPARLRNVVDGLTAPPVWDNDSWITNYIGHPLWGSETYLAIRRPGSPAFEAFLFSTASSIVWEYGIEAWAERPSIQDLLLTSTLGSVVGELRYRALTSLARSDSGWARPLAIAIDPVRAVSDLAGIRIRMGVGISSK